MLGVIVTKLSFCLVTKYYNERVILKNSKPFSLQIRKGFAELTSFFSGRRNGANPEDCWSSEAGNKKVAQRIATHNQPAALKWAKAASNGITNCLLKKQNWRDLRYLICDVFNTLIFIVEESQGNHFVNMAFL